MTAELTTDQSRALAEGQDRPLTLIDPTTNESYVLVASAEYRRLIGLDPRESYAAVERVFAEDWNDPKLDDNER